MSQIFDAMHRSEGERSGADLTKLSDAADLLEVAERQVAQFVTEGDHQTLRVQADQFSQFQSLQTRVSPESRLVCVTEQESLAAEKFRFLGVRLRHLQQTRPLKQLLVTSAMAEEGKSTVAANLACILARRQLQKTLLLEGDLRRPSLADRLGLGKIPGLSELLQGEPAASMNIYQLEGSGFWILPAGSPPRNPLELIQSGNLSLLMDQLAGWFDWIVIDSPPVLPLADTSVWMRMADAVLLVTRPGKTAKRQLQRALEAVEQSKLLGALVNGSKEVSLGDYYHYYASKTTGAKAGRTAGAQTSKTAGIQAVGPETK